MRKKSPSTPPATSPMNPVVTETDHKAQWLHDIHAIYVHAMNHEMYAIALRAKSLMAQAHGWLGKSVTGGKAGPIKPVCEWTPDDVNSILDQLSHYETHDAED